MGASRSLEQVRREIESERRRLTQAVDALREEAGDVRRRLPAIAGAAVAAGLALKLAARFLRRG